MTDGPNPGTYHDDLETATGQLSAASREIHDAYAALDTVEGEWFVLYDECAVGLKDEMVEEKRKGDPAEHAITSAARRKDPALFARWSQAKRAIKRAEAISQNRRTEISAFQSLIKNENSEAGAQDHLSQGQRRGRSSPTFGTRQPVA